MRRENEPYSIRGVKKYWRILHVASDIHAAMNPENTAPKAVTNLTSVNESSWEVGGRQYTLTSTLFLGVPVSVRIEDTTPYAGDKKTWEIAGYRNSLLTDRNAIEKGRKILKDRAKALGIDPFQTQPAAHTNKPSTIVEF